MTLMTSIWSKEQWDELAYVMHSEVFGNEIPEQAVSYDFVLLVSNLDGQKVAYSMIKELDGETAYMTFGGVFPAFKAKGIGYLSFHEMVKTLLGRYKRVGLATSTKNTPMIKLGLNEEFEIIGMRLVNGVKHIELLLEGGK